MFTYFTLVPLFSALLWKRKGAKCAALAQNSEVYFLCTYKHMQKSTIAPSKLHVPSKFAQKTFSLDYAHNRLYYYFYFLFVVWSCLPLCVDKFQRKFVGLTLCVLLEITPFPTSTSTHHTAAKKKKLWFPFFGLTT